MISFMFQRFNGTDFFGVISKHEVCLNYGMLLHAPNLSSPHPPRPPDTPWVVRYDYLRYDMKDPLLAQLGATI